MRITEVSDFVYRLVFEERQKNTMLLKLGLLTSLGEVSPTPHLKNETDLVSETLYTSASF
jgi:hypothetical protein